MENFIISQLQLPCVRPSLLSGMGTGFVFGLMTYLHKGNIKGACNVAVGSFLIVGALGIPICLQYRQISNKRSIRIDENSATREDVLKDSQSKI